MGRTTKKQTTQSQYLNANFCKEIWNNKNPVLYLQSRKAFFDYDTNTL